MYILARHHQREAAAPTLAELALHLRHFHRAALGGAHGLRRGDLLLLQRNRLRQFHTVTDTGRIDRIGAGRKARLTGALPVGLVAPDSSMSTTVGMAFQTE